MIIFHNVVLVDEQFSSTFIKVQNQNKTSSLSIGEKISLLQKTISLVHSTVIHLN